MAAKDEDIDRARSLYELGAGLSFVDRFRGPCRLAYVDRSNVVVHDFRSGRRKTVFSDGNHHVACPLTWSPDGRTLFHAHEQLLAIDVRTKKVRALTSFHGGDRFAIQWQLQCSPDGKTLVFLHHPRGSDSRWRIHSVGADGRELRCVSTLENVWSFTCNWETDELIVQTAKGAEQIVRIDLPTGAERSRVDGFVDRVGGLPRGRGARRRMVYESGGTLWLRSLEGTAPPEALARGHVPSLSPDGTTVAFMGNDDEVYVQRLNGGAAKLLVRALVPSTDDPRRTWSYRTAPRWSPDGKRLCVWSTIGTRSDEPLDAVWVSSLRRRQDAAGRAAAKRGAARAKASRTSTMDFAASIEIAHWSFEHSVGIVDFDAGNVWLTRGYWQDAAWAPVGTA